MRPNGQGGAQGVWSSSAVPAAVMLAMMRLVIYELDEGAEGQQSSVKMARPSVCLSFIALGAHSPTATKSMLQRR